jgi:hypothetical protein
MTLKTKNACIAVRITSEQKRELRKQSRMAGVTLGEWVRRVIAAALLASGCGGEVMPSDACETASPITCTSPDPSPGPVTAYNCPYDRILTIPYGCIEEGENGKVSFFVCCWSGVQEVSN